MGALGASTFAYMKVMEGIADQGVKITPDILITGGTGTGEGSGSVNSLIGLETLRTLKEGFGTESDQKSPKKTERFD